MVAVESPKGRNETVLHAHRSLRSSHLWLPNLTNKNARCLVKFEFHVHNDFFFSINMSHILHKHPIFYLEPLFPPLLSTWSHIGLHILKEFGISAIDGCLRLEFQWEGKKETLK